MRYEVMEMHLFDIEAEEEKALCGVDNSDSDPIAAVYYLEERRSFPATGQSQG